MSSVRSSSVLVTGRDDIVVCNPTSQMGKWNQIDLSSYHMTMTPNAKKQRRIDGLKAKWHARRRYRLLSWLLLGGNLFDPTLLLSESRLNSDTS